MIGSLSGLERRVPVSCSYVLVKIALRWAALVRVRWDRTGKAPYNAARAVAERKWFALLVDGGRLELFTGNVLEIFVEVGMRIKFLGTDSQNGGSPTMFATDRGTLVVRGYAITDAEALADLGEVPPGELDIEIPRELIRFVDSPMDHDPRTGQASGGAEQGER